MEHKIELHSASPEMIDAILTLAEAVYNLTMENKTNEGSKAMKKSRAAEKQVQAP